MCYGIFAPSLAPRHEANLHPRSMCSVKAPHFTCVTFIASGVPYLNVKLYMYILLKNALWDENVQFCCEMRNLFIKDTYTSSQLIYTYIGKIINKYLRDTTQLFLPTAMLNTYPHSTTTRRKRKRYNFVHKCHSLCYST